MGVAILDSSRLVDDVYCAAVIAEQRRVVGLEGCSAACALSGIGGAGSGILLFLCSSIMYIAGSREGTNQKSHRFNVLCRISLWADVFGPPRRATCRRAP